MFDTFATAANPNWSLTGGGVDDDNHAMVGDHWAKDVWHTRRVDLSAMQGNMVRQIMAYHQYDVAGGSGTIEFADIAVVSADSSVHPIYNAEGSMPMSQASSAGVTPGPFGVAQRPAPGSRSTTMLVTTWARRRWS